MIEEEFDELVRVIFRYTINKFKTELFILQYFEKLDKLLNCFIYYPSKTHIPIAISDVKKYIYIDCNNLNIFKMSEFYRKYNRTVSVDDLTRVKEFINDNLTEIIEYV